MTSYPVSPASTGSFVRQVRDILRISILEGVYGPGQRLNEVKLSHSLGISRGPIREALQSLAKEGLIELVANRGAFVPRFNAAQVGDLYDVREALELMAVRLAVERADDNDLSGLRQVLRATLLALDSGAVPHYPPEFDFHATIVRIAGNPLLTAMTMGIDGQLRLARGRSGFAPDRAREAYDEHLQIHDALTKRDVGAAVADMSRHLRRSREKATRLLSSLEQGVANEMEADFEPVLVESR